MRGSDSDTEAESGPDSGDPADAPEAIVSGGSMGGLFAGLSLREIGFDVEIYERSTGTLKHRGAGIVAQPSVLEFLRRRGVADPEAITTSTSRRLYLDADGNVDRSHADEMTFTSWDGVYRRLRDAFPDERYHAGAEVVDATRAGESVRARLADGTAVRGDLFVAAEGPRSSTRNRLLPDVNPTYAGYVAWRGVVPEGALPRDLLDRFEGTFPFYKGDSHLILGYLIPGASGETELGSRRLNWVWYDAVADDELRTVLTDADGRERDLSVPPGLLGDAGSQRLYDGADALPPVFERLVRETDEPFVQTVVDLAVPEMAFGRTCLLGDAAFVARPHTARGTAKAAVDAFELADALGHRDSIPTALDDWADSRLGAGRRLVERGKRMGRQRLERSVDG